jgi:DNA-binding transcriptional ArsR family regulator
MKTLAVPKVFYKLFAVVAIDEDASEEAKLRYGVLKMLGEIKAEVKGVTMVKAIKLLKLRRSTVYRWLKRLREGGGRIKALEDKSRRPRRVRQKEWDTMFIVSVEAVRTMFPGYGKAKIHGILRRLVEDDRTRRELIEMARNLGVERRLIEGLSQITKDKVMSESTIGRVLSYLKQRHVIKEPFVKKKRCAPRSRPYAERLQSQIPANEPGDVVQIDTMYVSIGEGKHLKQFTAVDRVVRWRCTDIYYSATALNAKKFLDKLEKKCPFKIKAIQVDGGFRVRSRVRVCMQGEGNNLVCK